MKAAPQPTAFIPARRSLVDLPTVLIAMVVFVGLTLTKKLPEPLLIGIAGIIGLFLRENVS
jgi:hypothetical protein